MILKNTLGVDVSDVKEQRIFPINAKFVVVRTSIAGDWLPSGMYGSDNIKYQIKEANKRNLMLLAYHGANFGDDTEKAKIEAQFAVDHAIKYGIRKGSYLALDWETKAGEDVSRNTKAIELFLDMVAANQYKPLLYIGEYYLKHIDLDYLINKYGDILWLASYLHGESIEDKVLSMEKKPVIMCQFTDKYENKYDGNVVIQILKNDLNYKYYPNKVVYRKSIDRNFDFYTLFKYVKENNENIAYEDLKKSKLIKVDSRGHLML